MQPRGSAHLRNLLEQRIEAISCMRNVVSRRLETFNSGSEYSWSLANAVTLSVMVLRDKYSN